MGEPAGGGRGGAAVRAQLGNSTGPIAPGGGGRGQRGGPALASSLTQGGSLKVVTTNFREGYLRKNGVPYSENATITEYFHRLPSEPGEDTWLLVITTIEDPRYLNGSLLHEHSIQTRTRRIEVGADALQDRAAAEVGKSTIQSGVNPSSAGRGVAARSRTCREANSLTQGRTGWCALGFSDHTTPAFGTPLLHAEDG